MCDKMAISAYIRNQTLYGSIYIQHGYHHAKFEFSSFSSLANTKGDGGIDKVTLYYW